MPPNAESVPVYTGASLRTVTLCEETAQQAEDGICPVHKGDACLYVYRHGYDNAVDRWKRSAEWGSGAAR